MNNVVEFMKTKQYSIHIRLHVDKSNYFYLYVTDVQIS